MPLWGMGDKDQEKKKVTPPVIRLAQSEYGQLWLIEGVRQGLRFVGPLNPKVIDDLALLAAQKVERGHLQDTGGFLKDAPPGYREAIAVWVMPIPMPGPGQETPVQTIVLEPESEHGRNTSSLAWHSADIATGGRKKPWMMYVNRSIFLDGKEKIVAPEEAGFHPPAAPFPNLVLDEEKKFYRGPITLLSTSYRSNDARLHSAKDRQRLEDDYKAHYAPGDRQLAVMLSVGNDAELGSNFEPSNSALYYFENSLLVGAADIERKTGPDSKPFEVFRKENYSRHHPSVMWMIAPAGANNYRNPDGTRTRFNGSSASTPLMTGGVVYPLLAKYVAVPDQPQKLLTVDDVLLAIRQTAHPIFTSRDNKESWQRDDLITNRLVGERYQSNEAGPGLARPLAADALLAAREAYARAHPEVREIKLVDKQYPLQGQRKKGNTFLHTFAVGHDLRANIITLDLHVRPEDSRDVSLTLIAPDGVSSMPLNLNVGETPDTGYKVARADGFADIPARGEWTLVSNVPLREGTLNLERAIPPGHYIEKVQPDYATMRRDAMRHADFSEIPRPTLDALSLKTFNLSQTLFPDGYLKRRLMDAVMARRDDEALVLLDSGAPEFTKARAEILQAVKGHNVAALVRILDGGTPSLALLREAIWARDTLLVDVLIKEGYAAAMDTKSGETALTTIIDSSYPDRVRLVERALASGAKATLNLRDTRGRTALIRAADKIYLPDEGPTILRMLVDNGADPSIKDDNERSIMFSLANMPDLADELARRCPALVTEPDKEGMTPVMQFMNSVGTGKGVLMLARQGADLSAKRRDGRTLLSFDHDGLLDQALLLQRQGNPPGVARAATTAELLMHQSAKVEQSAVADGQLQAGGEKFAVPATLKQPLIRGEKVEGYSIDVSLPPSVQTVYIDATDLSRRGIDIPAGLPKDSRIVFVINPKDVGAFNITYDRDWGSLRLQIEKNMVGGVRQSTKDNPIDLKRVEVATGSIKDDKIEITQRINVGDLLAKKEMLLLAAAKAPPAPVLTLSKDVFAPPGLPTPPSKRHGR